MNNKLISVIIPVYNVEEYLADCIHSLLTQTYSMLELIFVNDGSLDHSLAILDEYKLKDQRIKIIDQTNQGVSAARNAGLKQATGDIIAFVDPDDWVQPQYFEIMMYSMQKECADVIICEHQKVSNNERKVVTRDLYDDAIEARRISPEELLNIWTARHCVWAHMYKKSLLYGHLFGNIRIGEDTYFNLDVICHNKDIRIFYIEQPLYYWYQREDSITHKISPSAVLDQAVWYIDHEVQEEKTGSEYLLLIHVIKAALASRYYLKIEREKVKIADKTLRQLVPILNRSRYAPIKEKRILTLMYRFPFIYKLYRTVDDPTMLWAEWRAIKKRFFHGKQE